MVILAFEGRAGDEAARRFLVSEPAGLRAEQRNDAVVGIVAQRRARRDVVGLHDAVAVDDVEVLAVGRHPRLVDAVIAVAAFATVPRAQRVHHREAAVSLRIAQAVQAGLSALPPEAGIVHGLGERLLEPAALHVQGVVVPGDAHRFGYRCEDRLRLRDLARLVERQAGEGLLLVGAEDEAASIVFRDADPGALRRAVGLRHDLDLEAVERLDHLIRIGGILLNGFEDSPPALTRRPRRRRLSGLTYSRGRVLHAGRLNEYGCARRQQQRSRDRQHRGPRLRKRGHRINPPRHHLSMRVGPTPTRSLGPQALHCFL